MGKKIIKVTRWSWKSLLLLYGKGLTLVFALFCVASGQLVRSASNSAGNGITVKGRVLNAADSTVQSNFKIYLCEVMYPLYGTTSIKPPFYVPVDSAKSDESGLFEKNSTFYVGAKLGVMTQIDDGFLSPLTYTSQIITITNNPDTTYTLYMSPQIYSSVKNQQNRISVPQIQTIRGKTTIIRIPEWAGEKSRSAMVVDIKGKAIATLQASPEGNLSWNTGSAARGVYFVRIGGVGDVRVVVD